MVASNTHIAKIMYKEKKHIKDTRTTSQSSTLHTTPHHATPHWQRTHTNWQHTHTNWQRTHAHTLTKNTRQRSGGKRGPAHAAGRNAARALVYRWRQEQSSGRRAEGRRRPSSACGCRWGDVLRRLHGEFCFCYST